MLERFFPDDASSDGIHFDRPKGLEWINGVFQRHVIAVESVLPETAQFTFGPPSIPLSLPLDPYPVAYPDPYPECYGQNAGECSTSHQEDMGVS